MKKWLVFFLLITMLFASVVSASDMRESRRDALLKQYGTTTTVAPVMVTNLTTSLTEVEDRLLKLGYPEEISKALAQKVGKREFQTEEIASGTRADAVVKNGILYGNSTLQWKDVGIRATIEKYVVINYVVQHVRGQDTWFRIGKLPAQTVAAPVAVVSNSIEAPTQNAVNLATTAPQTLGAKNSEAISDIETLKANQKKWGNFTEASVWTGAWMNSKYHTGGVWFNLKYLKWYTKYEKPENFGVGINVRGDYGKILKNGKANWGYLAPGPMVGYYRGLSLRNSIEADASLLYRFDKNRPNGLMPTAHLEFNRILDYKNRLILQVDGSYFPKDSWLGPGVYLEHKLNKEWKVVVGAGASLSWLDGDFISGFQPSVRFKYKNRLNIGFNANLFTGLGTFYGIVLAYELTPDINSWYEDYKVSTVKLIKEGKMEAPAGFETQDPIGIEIMNQTIDEMDKNSKEETK